MVEPKPRAGLSVAKFQKHMGVGVLKVCSAMSDQITSFNARVRRIKDPRNQSYVDPETGILIPKRLSRKIIKTNNAVNQQKAGLGSVLLSVVLGLLCLFGARYIRIGLAEISDVGTDPSTLAAMDGGLAAIMAFIIGGILKHKSLTHMIAQVAGIAVMGVAMHNLVWFFPAEFAQMFGPDYVQHVTEITAPLSLHFNGETIIAL